MLLNTACSFLFIKIKWDGSGGHGGAEPPAPFSISGFLTPRLVRSIFLAGNKKTEKEQPLPQFVLSPFTKQTACAPKKQMLL